MPKSAIKVTHSAVKNGAGEVTQYIIRANGGDVATASKESGQFYCSPGFRASPTRFKEPFRTMSALKGALETELSESRNKAFLDGQVAKAKEAAAKAAKTTASKAGDNSGASTTSSAKAATA